MPSSDSDPPPVPSSALDGASEAPRERPLLSELAARIAQALRDLRHGSQMRESLEAVIEESDRESQQLSAQERRLLTNLLKVGDLQVADVMVPRADIVAVEEKASVSELFAVFREAEHSRLPLYRETLDDPLGMVHIKDVMAAIETGPGEQLRWPDGPITKLKRDMLFVPGAMPVLDLLLKMQATCIHLALVVDEYGGTDGLVSIEDLVEEIVGDIDDEHDVEEEPEIVARPEGVFVTDARASLEDFKDRTGIDLTGIETDEDVDTLGGVVTAALGRVPARGEMVTHAGLEFEILEADPRRVKRLRIRPLPAQHPAEISR